MYTGKVKWFNNAKGFGFIISQEHDEDLFAHYSVILIDGYKSLKAGQEVSFETTPGPKGIHAINIKPIEVAALEQAENS
ncbi:cold shock domain-containing protein [Aliamphritea ceti]|uniref:cold shock domain-containing protein n=1 Tax=Aliamphritea ceti TaxID=1524258 RepID=UPI0021C49DD4|nr:cold shock domain-containing protein [Aliamphritea ceti]